MDNAREKNLLLQNADRRIVEGFGWEWKKFNQKTVSDRELKNIFGQYFRIFPWHLIDGKSRGFDLGCGSGRLAKFVAERVGELVCVDASSVALDIARENLRDKANCRFCHASVGDMPIPEGSMDFGYSIGVLHHVPDTMEGLRACVNKLKPGAPFLVYLYYSFDNRPKWFFWLWRFADLLRKAVSRLPVGVKYPITQLMALFVYLPAARLAGMLERLGMPVEHFPLSNYRNCSFYTMKTDAYDRFATRMEKRFTRGQILGMMEQAGLTGISFSEQTPYWCAVGYKKPLPPGTSRAAAVRRLKLLFLTKYDRKAASTRYRFLQYIPYLEANGVSCENSPLLSDRYLDRRFNARSIDKVEVIRSFIRRWGKGKNLRGYDLIVLYSELFPYAPAWLERLAGIPAGKFIFDFDDAVFHTYDRHANPLVRVLLSNKIRSLIGDAAGVFAGNDYLAQYARRYNNNVIILPTVVDLERYRLREVARNPVFTLGWIGSPYTAVYLRQLLPALRVFGTRRSFRLILVGSGPIDLPGIDYEVREWREESEVDEILGFDAGIMPLPDNSWAQGKCGFKIIQYMACGLPVIASPVGINRKLVAHGENGFLAGSCEEWTRCMEILSSSPGLRAEMGRLGRQKVEREYCLSKTAPVFLEAVRRCAG